MRELLDDWEWWVWFAGALIVSAILPHHFERIPRIAVVLGCVALCAHAVRWVRYPGLAQSEKPGTLVERILLSWLILLALPVVSLLLVFRLPPSAINRVFPLRKLLCRNGLRFWFSRGQKVRIDPSSSKIDYRFAIGTVREIFVISKHEKSQFLEELPLGTVVYAIELHDGTMLKAEEAELDPFFEPQPDPEAAPSASEPRVPVPAWRAVVAVLVLILLLVVVYGFSTQAGRWYDEYGSLIFAGAVLLFIGSLSWLGFSRQMEEFEQKKAGPWMLWMFGAYAVMIVGAVLAIFFVIGGYLAFAAMLMLSLILFLGVKFIEARVGR